METLFFTAYEMYWLVDIHIGTKYGIFSTYLEL